MSPSAFAGNELLIDLAQLRESGWLTDANIAPDPAIKDTQVNYRAVKLYRMTRLRMAAKRFFADARRRRAEGAEHTKGKPGDPPEVGGILFDGP